MMCNLSLLQDLIHLDEQNEDDNVHYWTEDEYDREEMRLIVSGESINDMKGELNKMEKSRTCEMDMEALFSAEEWNKVNDLVYAVYIGDGMFSVHDIRTTKKLFIVDDLKYASQKLQEEDWLNRLTSPFSDEESEFEGNHNTAGLYY